MFKVLFSVLIFFAHASPSYWRCKNAQAVGFTDAPPFDGTFVELHFTRDYNETELEETVVALEKEGFTVTHDLCKNEEQRKKEAIEKQKLLEKEKEQRLKDQWNITNLEILCKRARDAFQKTTARNQAKWFWEIFEETWEPASVCPCFRPMDETGTVFELHTNQPCAELDCANRNSLFGACPPLSPSRWDGPRGFPNCINKIKIKV